MRSALPLCLQRTFCNYKLIRNIAYVNNLRLFQWLDMYGDYGVCAVLGFEFSLYK